MRQIIGRERECFAETGIEGLKRSGQFALDACARRGFLEIRKGPNRIAERDPYRRPPQWQPAFPGIKTIASDNYARENRNAGDVCEGGSSRPKRRAFQDRTFAVPNAAFRKNTHD